jgi:hypothetical protein
MATRLPRKHKNIFRTVFKNIGVLGPKGSFTERQLIQFIERHGIDALMLAEPNVPWQNLPENEQLKDRLKGQLQSYSQVTANNKTWGKWPTSHQYGGTAIIGTEQATHRLCPKKEQGIGRDKLGRWCWMRLQGKQGSHFRIFAAYQANPLSSSSGCLSVL